MIGWLLVGVSLVATTWPVRVIGIVAAATVIAVAAPFSVVPGALVGCGFLGWRRLRERTKEKERLREDAALLADLTGLALTGGLGIQPALEIAAGSVGGPLADEVDALLRQARVDGLAAAMTGAGGAAGQLYRVIGRAVNTGSALVDQVTRVADELHADLGAERLQKARRIPVAMLFPLTLLILPGFLLLTIAPALLDAIAHLEI